MAKASDSDVILYDTQVYEAIISNRTPVIDIAHRLRSQARGGGTMTSLVFAYATNKKIKYDRVIILSDGESWADGWGGYSNVNDAYNEYRSNTGANPFVYAIDIQGYGTTDVSNPMVTHLTGWSNKLLDFIDLNEKGEDMVKHIKNIELEAL
jgi:60 kDa SS-A/Ro ribonucleoprotein